MPWKTMTWKTWRNRLAYLAGSLFLAWHSVAMVLAPVPSDNVIVDTFRSFYHRSDADRYRRHVGFLFADRQFLSISLHHRGFGGQRTHVQADHGDQLVYADASLV